MAAFNSITRLYSPSPVSIPSYLALCVHTKLTLDLPGEFISSGCALEGEISGLRVSSFRTLYMSVSILDGVNNEETFSSFRPRLRLMSAVIALKE